MVMRRTSRSALAGLLAGAALAGCGSDDDAAEPAELTFHFYDASVPPEYHRSYLVTAGDGTVHIVVDSYGDVLHDEEAPLDQATFDAVVADVGALGDTGPPEDDGCTGGTSSELVITDVDGNVINEVASSSCGGEGVDQGELEAIVQPLLTGFDMNALLAPSE